MATPKLRIVYTTNEQVDAQPVSPASKQVTVRLEDVFPILAEAQVSGRHWLDDFADDPVTISSDLYEVLLAYQHHRKAA